MRKVRVKSAIPLYGVAAVWLLLGAVTQIYRLWAILLAAVLSAGAYLALSKFFPGREIEVEARPDSGDQAVDRDIAEARATLSRIRAAGAAIGAPEISARVSRMDAAGGKILSALEKDTGKAAQVRRFLNYYLPTTDKLLTRYRELAAMGGAGENVAQSLSTIRDSMEMIATAFEKQLDALYKDTALDIETDIDVLETIVKSEGHAGDGLGSAKQDTGATPLGGVK